MALLSSTIISNSLFHSPSLTFLKYDAKNMRSSYFNPAVNHDESFHDFVKCYLYQLSEKHVLYFKLEKNKINAKNGSVFISV